MAVRTRPTRPRALSRCELCRLRAERGEPMMGPTLGLDVIRWAEAMLVHGPGDIAGAPLEVDFEFGHFVMHAYEVDELGRRRIRRGYLSRPKGRAKTELAAVLACAELVGPVRFDGWDARGDPVGRPVVSPQVLCLATEEGQATTTYGAAAYMLAEGAAGDEYRLSVGLSRTYAGNAGMMLPDTSGAASAEGARTTFCVFDETHLWRTPSLRDLHAVVRRNLGKRKLAEPWSLETSVMYAPGDGSVAESLHRTWARIVAGELRDDGILVDHRQAPEVELDDDDDVLEAALRDVYGEAADWIDVGRMIAEIRDPQTEPEDARRYFLNQPVRSADAWLEAPELEAFDELASTRELERGEPVAIGFDGSLSDDATALVGVTLERAQPPHLFVVDVWEALEAERGQWVVDREAVNTAVARVFDELDVVLFYGDPAYWTPELAAWASAYGDETVREYPTSRDYRMGPATSSLHTAVVAAELTHDGDPRLRRHVGNARRRPTRYGVTLRKDRPGSPLKIDAAVASVLAFAARNDAIAANLDRFRRRRRHRRPRAPARLYAF